MAINSFPKCVTCCLMGVWMALGSDIGCPKAIRMASGQAKAIRMLLGQPKANQLALG